MINWLIIIAALTLLMLAHEAGHVIMAKLLGLKVTGFGLKLKPQPHLYVAVKWPFRAKYRNLYLAGGSLMTLILFITSYFLGFLSIQQVAIAFTLQIVLELNPFYSDITIALIYKKVDFRIKNSFQTEYNRHRFSVIWYIHFLAWAGIILVAIHLWQSLKFH